MRKFSHQRPVSPYLTLLEAVQASFGLTKQQLARLLGVSRATLAMEGRGATATGSTRSLPSAAVVRLAALQQQLPAPYGPIPTPPIAKTTAPILPEERETWQLRLQKIELEIYPLQQQLTRCQTRLAQARLRQQALPALQATLAAGDERTQQALERFGQDADLMLRYDTSAPQWLALRLRLLAYEKDEIQRLLAA